jgi:uncharacterized protein (DUF1778 family)
MNRNYLNMSGLPSITLQTIDDELEKIFRKIETRYNETETKMLEDAIDASPCKTEEYIFETVVLEIAKIIAVQRYTTAIIPEARDFIEQHKSFLEDNNIYDKYVAEINTIETNIKNGTFDR